MLCDDCKKKEVCKYMEKCKAYEEEYSTPTDEVITIEVNCKHRDTGTHIRNPILPNYPTPQWTRPDTIDKRITWDGRPEVTCKDGDTNA